MGFREFVDIQHDSSLSLATQTAYVLLLRDSLLGLRIWLSGLRLLLDTSVQDFLIIPSNHIGWFHRNFKNKTFFRATL